MMKRKHQNYMSSSESPDTESTDSSDTESDSEIDFSRLPSTANQDSRYDQNSKRVKADDHPTDSENYRVSASEFVAKINGLTAAAGDTLVKIVVGKGKHSKAYNLSKRNLTSVSDYFKAAFVGDWIEGETQTLNLEEEDPVIFDLIIQWIYCCTVFIDVKGPKPVLDIKSETISIYLKFLKLAKYLQINGPVETSIAPMRNILLYNEAVLQPDHIRAAAALPGNRHVLRLFAQNCSDSYRKSRSWHPKRKPFRFEKELEEVDGFALELLRSLPMEQM